MLLRHRKAQAKSPRKDADATKARGAPAPPSSALHPLSENTRPPSSRRAREQPQGTLDFDQSAVSRKGPRSKHGPNRGCLPVSPIAAMPALGRDEEVDHRPLHPIIDAHSRDERDLLHDVIASKFDEVISSIDGETFAGKEDDLCMLLDHLVLPNAHDLRAPVIQEEPGVNLRGGWGSGYRAAVSGADRRLTSAVLGTNYFAKAKLYANSRLPTDLPSLHLSIPYWPLVCLAAQYSRRAYTKPSGAEREAFVSADWRIGTKAMVIKSVPIDNMDCVVFAIRGSQTFLDWAVNLNSAPVSPGDFLDDPGNLCHQGFLSVARKMIKPVAARLRFLLEENPRRSTCSLLMTGHSAGGAVASLLYAHMLAENVKSELNTLTGCFKRIHCLTFGSPPISLLPLSKPPVLHHKKSLFMSFINEGDPVPRADKAYVRSLLVLYASPAPSKGRKCSLESLPVPEPYSRAKARNAPKAVAAPSETLYEWNVPPGTFSNAGRLIVLRELNSDRPETADDIKADITCDQQLREVVFGDPIMHMMSVYARRVEVLATKAVTANIWAQ